MSNGGPPAGDRFETATAAELAADRSAVAYHIGGILPVGQPCVWAGGKKTLKTNTLINATLSLASGLPFLGAFDVRTPCRAGLLSGESGKATIGETARRIAGAKGADLAAIDGAVFGFRLPKLAEPAGLAELRAWINAHRLGVVALDPAYLCMPIGDDAGNLFKVGRYLDALAAVGRDTGSTIVLVHHSRKRKQRDHYRKPELDDLAWAGFAEWARAWVMFARREAYDPAQSVHRLWLYAGGSAGHHGVWGLDIDEGHIDDAGGRRWEVAVAAASEVGSRRASAASAPGSSQPATAERRTARILAVMAELGPSSRRKIQRSSKVNGKAFGPVWSELKAAGLIVSDSPDAPDPLWLPSPVVSRGQTTGLDHADPAPVVSVVRGQRTPIGGVDLDHAPRAGRPRVGADAAT